MNAHVEIQNVLLIPEHELKAALRAVCWNHPRTELFVPPWQGHGHVIEQGKASGYNAELDAKIHNVREHQDRILK